MREEDHETEYTAARDLSHFQRILKETKTPITFSESRGRWIFSKIRPVYHHGKLHNLMIDFQNW